MIINLQYFFLKKKSKVQIWIYEQINMRIEGRIIVIIIIFKVLFFELNQNLIQF